MLLTDYINHDKELRNNGIINKDVYIRKMFDWTEDEENQYYILFYYYPNPKYHT